MRCFEKGVRGLCAAAILVSLAACDQTAGLGYRMTVAVDDNGKTITRSAVRRDVWTQQHGNIDGDLLTQHTEGDAIVIPVRGRQLVVSLAAWSYYPGGPYGRGPGCTGPGSTVEGVKCWVQGSWSPLDVFRAALGYSARSDAQLTLVRAIQDGAKDRQLEVAHDALPVLLTFQDEPGLQSIRAVDADHLEAAFGQGVSLRRVTVTTTSDPVTRNIDVALPFVRTLTRDVFCAHIASKSGEPPAADGSRQILNPDLGICASRVLFTG